jgi:hypothetical protein
MRLVFKFFRGSNDFIVHKNLFIAINASLRWLNPLSYGLFCAVHLMAKGPVGSPYEEDI